MQVMGEIKAELAGTTFRDLFLDRSGVPAFLNKDHRRATERVPPLLEKDTVVATYMYCASSNNGRSREKQVVIFRRV